MKKIKAKTWSVSYFLLLLIICLSCVIFIFKEISRKTYDEHVDYLQEIYGYANSSFSSLVTRNWNLLSDWDIYVEYSMFLANEDETLKSFVEGCRKKWGFMDFYFFAENGDYVNIDGDSGHFDLDESFGNLGKYSMETVELENGTELTLFTAHAYPGVYCGVSYAAIGIGYNNEVFQETLNLPDYEGKASCHVVYPDGEILYSVSPFSNNLSNYFSFLQENAEFFDGSAEQLRRDIQNGTNGVFRIKLNDIKYYLVYQHLDFQEQNWGLLGVVPMDMVNSNMNRIQWVLVGMLTLVFFIVALAGTWHLRAISNQKIQKKELALMHQEQMFSILVNSTTDIFVMFSVEDLKVEYVSPNIQTLLGISLDQLYKDLSLITLTAVKKETPTREELMQIPIGETIQVMRERVHQKTGDRRWFQETVYHCMFEGTDKYILVMSERTKEMESQRQLEVAVKLAKSANEAKSVFLSNMSHDIRTPINAIIGFSLLLSQDSGNAAKVREYTRKITSSSQHLLSLINDVLDMSKIESGKTTLNVAEFQLGMLLEEINVVIRPQTKAKNQQFVLKVRGVYEDRLMGDQVRINQVLLNLLSNAIKYTGEGGVIELNVTQEQVSRRFVHLCFQITDNGMGISPEYMEIMFDSFTREANTTISGIQGTGLGLAITKSLVDLMGGTINVESEKGVGTTFTVNMDLLVAEDGIEEDFWKNHNIRKILAVDDEEDLCLDIQNIVTRLGIEVDYAMDGESAVQLVEEAIAKGQPYDVVLLDWVLKEGTSLDVARCIMEIVDRDSMVMVMTAYDWSEFEDDARAVGVNAFMHKPFFLTDFRQVVQQARRKNKQIEKHSDEVEDYSVEGLRILAAEDNELNAEILYELLELEGASCELAENGQIAVEKFRASEPGYYDIILMDIQMPVMNGYDATQAIRRCGHPESSTIPIAAMTANAFAEDVQDSLDSGMNAHIGKPIDMDILKKTITQLIAQRRDGRKGKGNSQ